MSRKQFKLSDFDKYLKPIHLGGKPQTLLVSHVGVIAMPSRQKEQIIAGDNPEEMRGNTEDVLILHFREFPKPMRVTQATNRAKLFEVCGDDPKNIVGCRVTLATAVQENFGREFISIVKVEKMNGRNQEPSYRETMVHRLSELRQQEKTLLDTAGQPQTPLDGQAVKAMTLEDIEALVQQTESNVLDLKAAQVTNI